MYNDDDHDDDHDDDNDYVACVGEKKKHQQRRLRSIPWISGTTAEKKVGVGMNCVHITSQVNRHVVVMKDTHILVWVGIPPIRPLH